MHLLRSKSDIQAKAAFGWNYRTWVHPVYQSGVLRKQVNKVLEIGASQKSIAGILFDGNAKNVVVGYYEQAEKNKILDRLEISRKKLGLSSHYSVRRVDAFEVEGEYDIILLKSVVGGLFRNRDADTDDVVEFLQTLAHNSLTSGGQVVSIDNGRSFAEGMLQNIGSRKNGWRYFKLGEIGGVGKQYSFGVLSWYSLQNKFGKWGAFADRWVIYPLDSLLFRWFKNYPTVIVTIISKL